MSANGRIGIVFFLKGFVALCAQILLLREFFIVLAGNELYFGTYFAIWVISGALGSFAARYIRTKSCVIFLILVLLENLWLFSGLCAVRLYHEIFSLSPGQIPEISQSILLLLITSGIFNFFQGVRFVIAAQLMKNLTSEDRGPGLFYGWESAGALFGGIVFAFVLQKIYNPFQIAAIIAISSMISFIPLFSFEKKHLTLFLYLMFLFPLFFFFFYPENSLYTEIHLKTLMKQWNLNNPPVYYANTHYGNITAFENNRQISLIIDGKLLLTAPCPDMEWIETMAHFPLLYSEETNHVLLIGAGIKGIIPEILKYKVKKIDCLEIDPEIVSAIKRFSPSYFPGFGSEKINIIQDDALRFLRRAKENWDVIIADAGFPYSLKNARFYTEDFFKLVKKHLSEKGVFFFGLEGSPQYMSEPLCQVHSIVYSSLKSVFPSVEVIPGYFTNYCASTKLNAPELSSNLMALQKKEKNIQTVVLSDFYLQDRLDKEKKEYFLKMIKTPQEIKNTASRPFIVIPALKYWIFFSTGKLKDIEKPFFAVIICLIISMLAVFLPVIRKQNRKTKILEFVVFSTGFLVVALELIFMFSFQIFHGSLFFYLSVLTGLFMGGMTAGSILFSVNAEKEKNWPKLLFIWQIVQMAFSIVVLLITTLSKATIPAILFFILITITGFFAGWEFPLVNKIYLLEKNKFSDSISRFYAVDLFGATAGSLLTPIFFVPLLGISFSLVLFAFIKLIVALFLWELNLC